MDINKLISNIEKYLGKDLKFSMREFRQLKLLREDVLKLEEIISHRVKNQAGLLEHYREHARGIERYSERIEKRMNVWIKRLETLVIDEAQSLTPKDRQYFESWINNINICRNTLIRILARNGELHKLINEKSPDWKKVEAKINEAFGDNQHPGLRTLIVLFQQLEQVEERAGKVLFEGIIKERRLERLEQLGKWGFPVWKESQLADFLVKHWSGTIEMAKASGWNVNYLFGYGLPAVKDIINERTWPGMVEMAKAAGGDAGELFLYGLPDIKDLINERTWPGMVEMAKAAGGDAVELFRYGLPAVSHIINERTWPMIVKGFTKMAKAAGVNTRYLFQNGLPAVNGIINERTWPIIVGHLTEIGKYADYVKSQLGFIPKSLFTVQKAILDSKSAHDIGELL